MASIEYIDLGSELTDELEAMNGQLVGQLAAVLTRTTKEEKVAALAITVNYFKMFGDLDMEKFHALLALCDAKEESDKYIGGYFGPPVKA